MKTVPLIAVKVRRDAMTTIPTEVPAHEVRILRAVHGKDNVYPSDEVVGSAELDPLQEGARLRSKYGEGAVVAAYGEDCDDVIAEAVSSAEAAKPATKRAAATA